SVLYINDGAGHFTADVTRLPPEVQQLWAVACVFVDVDNDGDLDLVVAPFVQEEFQRDLLLLNDGRGNFRLAGHSAMPPRYGGIEQESVSIATADFDSDGWPDLLMGTHRGYQEPYLQLLLNNGDGTFRDATDSIPPQIWPLSSITGEVWIKWITPADLNGDGWVDFVTSTVNADPRLYLNMGRAQFQDASEILPVLPNFVSLLLAGDLDGDGDVDLFVTTGSGNYLVARNLKPFGPVPSPKALTVTKSGSGRGWVTSSPAGIRCGGDCSETYTAGTIVTLGARAGPRSVFAGWSGACSGTDACTVTMDADKAVSASFSRR
ncbi:MAG: VCBS repeat-containing protein, partial [Candidatus Rokubacteria bacterium]|nr:VCBS repeat-containing protein [Candidatus Rokubacteria bacterium]